MQVIIKLTSSCNLKCVYCSEGDKPAKIIEEKTLKKVIDEVPLLLDSINQKKIDFLWHGGEPLLYGKENLRAIMDYALEKLKDYKLTFLIQTNGTLIDDEWIDIFKIYDVHVGVSVDGYQELHDANRVDANGQPTWEIVVNNIKRMQKQGILVGGLMVLNTEKIIDVDKLYSFIKDMDISPKIHSVIPCGRAAGRDINSVYDNYVKLLKDLFRKIVEDDSSNVIINPLDELMNAIILQKGIGECSFNGSCGEHFICVQADGTVGFCGRALVDDKEFMYGNIKDSNLLDLYRSRQADAIRERQEYLRNNDCSECDCWTLCHGGCSYEAINAYGDLRNKYVNCEQRKVLINFLRTEGLDLLKQKIIRRKTFIKEIINQKKRLLQEIKDVDK